MSLKIALAGNPNCGKTTLFNALTGSNQFVGNWPGVTVEKKEGKLKFDKEVTIMDLPGIYSLSPYTLEEVVARTYLINERPDAILNIVDGTNLERNLYLSTQIMELGIPVVMAVNMIDILEKTGDTVDTDKLSEKLGCTVVKISALKGRGIKEAAEQAVKVVKKKEISRVVHSFADDVESVIEEVMDKVTGVDDSQKRFFAIKLLEKDDKIAEMMKDVPDVSAEIKKLEDMKDDDVESIIVNERYTYISSIIGDCIKKAAKKKLSVSDKIDRVVTNRFAALPIFAAIMFLVYFVSMSTVGSWATDWANDGVFGDGWHLFGIGSSKYSEATDDWAEENIFSNDDVKAVLEKAAEADVIGAGDLLDSFEDADFDAFSENYGSYADSLDEAGYSIAGMLPLDEEGEFESPDPADYGVWVPGIPVLVEKGLNAIHCVDWLQSLILDGIIAGVGAVLGFVPQMLVLFIFLAFLEACGYMARVAFIMDRIFRKFGLSGKSFIPMLIGSGCGVPGIMASRTIESDRDRKMTIMTTTFIPCGAKMPIIAMIGTALFRGAWWIAPLAYFAGVAAIICSGIILKKTKIFAGDPAPFVMELPAYHLPTVGNVLRSMWERGSSFIKKAGTIILLSSIVIWAGSVFGWDNGFGFHPDMELADSILGHIGNGIKWIFAPLGFGDASATIATIMGLVAKEEVVGVFGVLDFIGLTKLAGISFMLFNLFCAPCFAALGAIKREMNSAKWFWITVAYQCVFAYLVSFVVYNIGGLFTGLGFTVATAIAILIVIGFVYLLVRPYKESNHLNANVKLD